MIWQDRVLLGRRRTALLAAVAAVPALVALLFVPVVGGAPGSAPAVEAARFSGAPLLTSSAPVTLYLPLIFKVYPPSITYFDEFTDTATGWPMSASSICNPHTNEPITKAGKPEIVVQWTRGYNSGEYQIFVPPANATAVWFCQPNALAPWIVTSDVYTVETMVRYVDGEYQGWALNPWWDNAGLIFGANEANDQLFMICLGTQTYDDGTRTIRWNIHANTVYPHKFWDVPDKPYAFPYRGCSEDWLRVLDPWRGTGIHNGGYNHLKAVVNGDTVTVYINDTFGAQVTLPGLAATTRVGVIGGPYEYTPSDIRFDWFKLTVQYAP